MRLSLFLIIADRRISVARVEGERHEAERADGTERGLNIDHLLEEARREFTKEPRLYLESAF